MKRTSSILAIAFALILCGPIAWSQDAPAPAKPNPDTLPVRTFYLNNVRQQSDLNEVVSTIRNMLPTNNSRIYMVLSQNAILVRATPDDLALAQKIITDLDRPKKNYRLTYTVTETDGGKQIGTQHYAIILASGQQTTLKLGNRIPVATGSYSAGGSNSSGAGVQTQFTYVDIGMNIDLTLTTLGDGAMLRSNLERSSAAPEKSDIAGVQEPIIRQASLRGESFLAPGKSQPLGSLDIPGSTSHLQIEVVMEPLP
jgi:type II secretory pathway component GspD/PulD (secretin)